MIQKRSDIKRAEGKIIGFVPTMGFLHEGHLKLLSEARKLCDDLILSIFVNPAQFGPNEDLDSYPKSLEDDLRLAEKEGVDAVYTPNEKTIYTKNFQTYVELEKLPNHLCGLSRPVFFRGVTTVVTKLFNIVKPHITVFGQKDFQQLAIIKQMVKDLNFNIEVIGVPTVREQDGLAMSSRNSYLSESERKTGLCLYESLNMAKDALSKGKNEAKYIIDKAVSYIESKQGTEIDYISICDPDTLVDVEKITKPTLMALAVKVGKTRLIDNMTLSP